MSGFDCWVPKNSKKFLISNLFQIKHQNFSLKIHYTNPLSLSHAMALSACVQFLVKFLTVVRYDDLPHVQFAVNTICPRPLQVWTLVWGGRADRKWKKTPGWPRDLRTRSRSKSQSVFRKIGTCRKKCLFLACSIVWNDKYMCSVHVQIYHIR